MALRVLVALFLLVLGIGLAQAEDAYSDNRSSAQDLVRSLYNAINHHEYARAYDYFASPPAKDFATFQAGYEHTAHVDLLLGDVSGDGAAGSIYFSVPAAIKATDDKGDTKVFLGCYTVRAVNGAIQEPPYRPLQIEKGALKPGKAEDFAVWKLPKCGDAAEKTASSVSIDNAKARFESDQDGNCDKVEDTRGGLNDPAVFTLVYREAGAAAGDPEKTLKLYKFLCRTGAYNEVQMFYMEDPAGGLHVVSFAEPHFAIKYQPGDEESAKLVSMVVDGFTATTELINAEYDEKTKSIADFAKWRGIGDAASNGTWVFDQGQFVLKDYSVDPTYDGEQNPIDVIKGGKIK